jgi:hypothetical protein
MEIECDAIMVSHMVLIMCSKWITCMVMFVFSTCLCTQLYYVTYVVISCSKRGKSVWHELAWGHAHYFKYFYTNQCYRVESVD